MISSNIYRQLSQVDQRYHQTCTCREDYLELTKLNDIVNIMWCQVFYIVSLKLFFFFLIFCLSYSKRYTYGKGAKGRANVQVYFNTYGWEKKPSLAKDIVSNIPNFQWITTIFTLYMQIITACLNIYEHQFLKVFLISCIPKINCKL